MWISWRQPWHWPDVMSEFTRSVTRVGAYALARRGEQVLLTQLAESDREAGRWTLPGGGLDFGEDPELALHREVYEETSLSGTVDGLLGIHSRVFTPRSAIPGDATVHAVRLVYRMHLVGRPRVVEVGGSTVAARWVPLDELETLPQIDLIGEALRLASGG
jgi:8-oxo-dGTP diphosphatase